MKLLPVFPFFGTLLVAAGLAATYPPDPQEPPAPPKEAEVEVLPGPLASSRSYLGVGVAEIDSARAKSRKLDEERGVEVTKVVEDSPAAKAGIKTGDIVLEYNGQKVMGTEQFVRLVRETPVGRTVKLLISRDGRNQTVSAVIGNRRQPRRVFTFPSSPDWGRLSEGMGSLNELRMPDIPKAHMSWRTSVLGVEAESVEAQLADYFGVKEGVLIRSVLKDSPAEKAGLKAGDVIVKVNETKVATPRDVSSAIRTARSQKTFPVTVVRNRSEVTVTVTIENDRSGRELLRELRIIRHEGPGESRL